MTSNLIASRTYDAYDSIVLRLVDKLVGNDAHSRTSVQQMDPTNVQYNKKEKKKLYHFTQFSSSPTEVEIIIITIKKTVFERKRKTLQIERTALAVVVVS